MNSLVGIVLLFTSSTGIFAQKTDFSGNWKLLNQQKISGRLYANGVPAQMNVNQKEEDITIERTSTNANGNEVIITFTMGFNGKQTQSTSPSGRKVMHSMTWESDNKGFTTKADMYSTADTQKVEIVYADVWIIEDGKLIMIRKAENFGNGEKWESKATYVKQ